MGQENGMFSQVGIVVVKWDMPIRRILYVPSFKITKSLKYDYAIASSSYSFEKIGILPINM